MPRTPFLPNHLRTRFLVFFCLLLLLCVPMAIAQPTVDAQKHATSQETPGWFGCPRKPNPSGMTLKDLHYNSVLGRAQTPRKQKAAAQKKHSLVDDFSVRYDSEKTTWNARPSQHQSGEHMGIHEQHRLRAYTHVKESKDFDLRAGPEVIFKDASKRQALESVSNQPDSELGVGMQFEYTF